jgi:hypothetical protein
VSDLVVRPATGDKVDNAPLVLCQDLEHRDEAASWDPEIPLGLGGTIGRRLA